MKRPITMSNIMNMNTKYLAFDNEWQRSFGRPEPKGTWLIWGGSGSGKTTFAMQLIKYLASFDTVNRVAYNSLEEGSSLSIKMALERVGMWEVKDKFWLLNDTVGELQERLSRQRSPRVIVIDSVQYSGMNYPEYVKLRSEFPDRLFIMISHADGRLPQGRTAKSIRYDAFVKVPVEGYAAFPVSRYSDGGSRPYLIWPEGAKNYHGTSILQ